MLLNPFTPSEIAAGADQFFGRAKELATVESALAVGSVLIQGPIGIGKSSLLARAVDLMGDVDCDTHVIVVDKEVDSIDDVARMLLDSLVSVDEKSKKLRLKFGAKLYGVVEPAIEIESSETAKDLNERRFLAALKRVLDIDHKRRRSANRRYLILGIDEADKAPQSVARLVRSIWTHCQQIGVRDVRFIVAGVSPVHQALLAEDAGIERAFNRVLTLSPMGLDDTEELLVTKFKAVLQDAGARGMNLTMEPAVIERITQLSGGHPHIAQLLGSHILQHEIENGDGVLSVRDLLGGLQRVCYEDRKATYAALLHMVESAGKLDSLLALLKYAVVDSGFPTRIYRQQVAGIVDPGDVQWLVEHDILVSRSPEEYGLVDEFLRVRLAMDAEKVELRSEVEAELLDQGRLLSFDEIVETYGSLDAAEGSEPE